VGNPGTGKSTLLNGILGEAKFKAGINISGITTKFQWEIVLYGGIDFADTPGLAHIKSREQAGEEITNAFKSSNDE
jgi:ribosome biogenesis GTPase A